jgi:hypothetical protein
VEFKGGLNDSPGRRREPLSSRCERYEMIGEIGTGGLDEAQVGYTRAMAQQLPARMRGVRLIERTCNEALTTRDLDEKCRGRQRSGKR